MEPKSGDVLAFAKSNSDAPENKSMATRQDAYKDTGVDTAEADAGLSHIVRRVKNTWPHHGMGRVLLRIRYFANVIEIDGVGVALCTDEVASNTLRLRP